MVRFSQILSCIGVVLISTGCTAKKEKPIWEYVKIGELAPATRDMGSQSLGSLDFDVHIMDIPASNIKVLDEVWPMLQTRQLSFSNYEAFKANSFVAGLGQVPMWDTIRKLLISAGAKKLKTVSLLIPDEHFDEIPVAELNKRQTIFYVSGAGSMEGVDIGPGEVVLRIKAGKTPNMRGVCEVVAEPQYLPPGSDLGTKAKISNELKELVFSSAGFNLKMSPSDFVFLGPSEYVKYQISLGGLFFSRNQPKEIVRIYLIVCTRVNE
jgi:hypothetical protein